MGRHRNLFTLRSLPRISHKFRGDFRQKFAECHRPQIKIRHSTNRHRKFFPVKSKFQERSGRDDRQIGTVLVEVPKRSDGFRNRLNFIEKQQCPRSINRTSQYDPQLIKDARDVKRGKDPPKIQMTFKVDFIQNQPMLCSKLPNERGFANLTRTTKDKRFTSRGRIP